MCICVALHWVSVVDRMWPVSHSPALCSSFFFLCLTMRSDILFSLHIFFVWTFVCGFKIELCRIFEAFRYISTNLIVVYLMRAVSFLFSLSSSSLFKSITITKLPSNIIWYSIKCMAGACGMWVSNRTVFSFFSSSFSLLLPLLLRRNKKINYIHYIFNWFFSLLCLFRAKYFFFCGVRAIENRFLC